MQDEIARANVELDTVDDDMFDSTESEDEANGEFRPLPDDDAMETTQAAGVRKERSAMPSWLQVRYADLRERLEKEIKANRILSCYRHGTFIDGSPFPFFSANEKFAPSPEEFYEPTFFVWLPDLFLGKEKIPCPNCKACNRKSQRGHVMHLNIHGWMRSPRRIVDLHQCLYIVTRRYRCRHPDCKRTYAGWSPALRAALPRALALQFQFHLTYRGGLTDQVVSQLRSSFLHGMGPVPFANLIRNNHIRRYEHAHLQYLELVFARKHATFAKLLPRFQPFGEFSDRDGYAGFIPSPQYFRRVYVQFISSHAHEMDQHTSMLSSRLLQIDHSFKVNFLSYISLLLV